MAISTNYSMRRCLQSAFPSSLRQRQPSRDNGPRHSRSRSQRGRLRSPPRRLHRPSGVKPGGLPADGCGHASRARFLWASTCRRCRRIPGHAHSREWRAASAGEASMSAAFSSIILGPKARRRSPDGIRRALSITTKTSAAMMCAARRPLAISWEPDSRITISTSVRPQPDALSRQGRQRPPSRYFPEGFVILGEDDSHGGMRCDAPNSVPPGHKTETRTRTRRAAFNAAKRAEAVCGGPGRLTHAQVGATQDRASHCLERVAPVARPVRRL